MGKTSTGSEKVATGSESDPCRHLFTATGLLPESGWARPSAVGNYKLFFVLLEENPILPMTPRDGCEHSTVYSNLFKSIPAYSGLTTLFQPIPAYSILCQPIPAFSSHLQIPNLQFPIPNIHFEMHNCAFYPQLAILSVSSLSHITDQYSTKRHNNIKPPPISFTTLSKKSDMWHVPFDMWHVPRDTW